MIKNTYIAEQDTWFIAHNGEVTIHYGFVSQGEAISTGQPTLELFYNEEDWIIRLAELGIIIENNNDNDNTDI